MCRAFLIHKTNFQKIYLYCEIYLQHLIFQECDNQSKDDDFMFYEKLDAIMLQANIKNKDLTAAAGLFQSFISKLRRGVSVPLTNSYIIYTGKRIPN